MKLTPAQQFHVDAARNWLEQHRGAPYVDVVANLIEIIEALTSAPSSIPDREKLERIIYDALPPPSMWRGYRVQGSRSVADALISAGVIK